MASIALSCQVDFTAFELRILVHEALQEKIEVLCDAFFREAQLVKRLNKAETCASRLVQIEHISMVVPRVGIILEDEWIFNVI